MNQTERSSPNPAKRERRTLKSKVRQLNARREKIDHYQKQKDTFKNRNSYSKTDTDATFMRMKDDHMRNGQLKPGYNLQIATSNQFVLGYQLFPNPTDTRTFPPFVSHLLESMKHIKFICADAGYGSESNYRFLETDYPDIIPLIPYGTMRKEKSRKWKKDPKKIVNWQYEEKDDYFIDPLDVRFNFSHYSRRKDKYGFVRDYKTYKAEIYDENLNRIPEALTPKGHPRQVYHNPSWE